MTRQSPSLSPTCLKIGALIGLMATACFDDVPSDKDETMATNASDSNQSNESAWPDCSEVGACLPVPPDEWIIYAALWHEPISYGDEPTRPECPADFPRERIVLDAYEGATKIAVGVACLGNPLAAKGCPDSGNLNCVAHPPSPFGYDVCALWSSGESACPTDSPFQGQWIFAVDGDPEHRITLCCMVE